MTEQGNLIASSLVYDDTLGQEIIDGDTDLTKEIYVEAGTTVDRIRETPMVWSHLTRMESWSAPP